MKGFKIRALLYDLCISRDWTRFGRIELAIYPNKQLDLMDFDAKEALNSSLVRTESNHENLKKNQKFEPFPRFVSVWYALKRVSL